MAGVIPACITDIVQLRRRKSDAEFLSGDFVENRAQHNVPEQQPADSD